MIKFDNKMSNPKIAIINSQADKAYAENIKNSVKKNSNKPPEFLIYEDTSCLSCEFETIAEICDKLYFINCRAPPGYHYFSNKFVTCSTDWK